MESNEEILPVVDASGNIVDSATRTDCHNGSMLLHAVVHLHILKPNCCILLQKRAITKKIQPGKWDTAVGGHISLGESVKMALSREAKEEIGLKDSDIIDIKSFNPYIMTSDVERELVFSHLAIVRDSFIPEIEEGEAEGLQFCSHEDIKQMLENKKLTPNFEDEYVKFLQHI